MNAGVEHEDPIRPIVVLSLFSDRHSLVPSLQLFQYSYITSHLIARRHHNEIVAVAEYLNVRLMVYVQKDSTPHWNAPNISLPILRGSWPLSVT
jgi:hypothetical protein